MWCECLGKALKASEVGFASVCVHTGLVWCLHRCLAPLTAQIAVMGTWKDPSLLLKMSWNCFVASILYEDGPLCSAMS